MQETAGDFAQVAGTWFLVGENRIYADADIDSPTHRVDGNDVWMHTRGTVTDVATATRQDGLTLTIAVGGTFTEDGVSKVSLFDADGAETSGEAFSGRLEPSATGFTVFTDHREIREPVLSISDTTSLRISDGDTDIAEFFEVIGSQLVRTQNVATDGLYLTRVVLVYDRVAPTPLPRDEVVPVDRSEAEEALLVAVHAELDGSWKRVVALMIGDSGGLLGIMTFAVVQDVSGEHRLESFSTGAAFDAAMKRHRSTVLNDKGKQWGNVVLLVEPPATITWDVDYKKTDGDFYASDRFRHYNKYLPHYLAEHGLDR